MNNITHAWDKACKVANRLEMEWRPLGKILRDQHGKLLFPKTERCPAIYRFRIRYTDSEAIYIGETDNLKRRFGNYRNPGPSQKTSLRINAILNRATEKKAEIAVSVVVENALITRENKTEIADLSSKFVRCIFENAAILESETTNVEILNKVKTQT
ncbi:MAG: GIY-YIG nuclease family protein [Bdellovibrionales bacterium]